MSLCILSIASQLYSLLLQPLVLLCVLTTPQPHLTGPQLREFWLSTMFRGHYCRISGLERGMPDFSWIWFLSKFLHIVVRANILAILLTSVMFPTLGFTSPNNQLVVLGLQGLMIKQKCRLLLKMSNLGCPLQLSMQSLLTSGHKDPYLSLQSSQARILQFLLLLFLLM